MKKEVYILKPVIKKTGTTHAYNVYTCVDFALFHKRKIVDSGFDCFNELPINSRAKSKKAFDNIDLSKEIETAKKVFELLMFSDWGLGEYTPFKYKMKCVGNKFIFIINR